MISWNDKLSTIFLNLVNSVKYDLTERYCLLCAERHHTTLKMLCSHCYQSLPLCPTDGITVQAAHALFLYDFPINRILPRFKYAQQPKWQKLTLEVFYHALQGAIQPSGSISSALNGVDWITPVPMARAKQARRGFNQSLLLARVATDVLNAPLIADLCLKETNTRSQASLGKQARQQNLQASFCVNPKYRESLAGKRVLIVDDVTTTGATLGALQSILIDAGAEEVTALCLAATPLRVQAR